MADVLSFRNEDGDTINEINFRRTIKGIPSLITPFKLRNESDRLGFRGRLVVTPSFGRSYSEDAAISDNGNTWTRSLNIDVPALSDVDLRMRIIPLTTPPGATGSSSITVLGDWYT
jgi:hypothetical protein